MAASSFAQAPPAGATGAAAVAPSYLPTTTSFSSRPHTPLGNPTGSFITAPESKIGSATPATAGSSGGASGRVPRRGPCNFRDLSLGHKCGCTTFWADESRLTLQQLQQQEVHWCVCGHHACYHHLVESAATSSSALASITAGGKGVSHLLPSGAANARALDNGVYLQLANKPTVGAVSPKTGASTQLLRDYKATFEDAIRQDGGTQPAAQTQNSNGAYGGVSFGRWLRGSASICGEGPPASIPSTISMPPIPSMCLLDSQDLRPIQEAIRRPTSPMPTRAGPRGDNFASSRGNTTGLGLSMRNPMPGSQYLSQKADQPFPRHGQASKVPDYSQPRYSVPSSISNVNVPQASPSRAFMQSIMERRLTIPTEIQDTVPDPINPEDFIVSATEIATPSAANTPDLRSVEQTVGEAKNLAEWLANNLLETGQGAGSQGGSEGKATAVPQRVMALSPANPQGSFQNISVTSIRSALSKLGAHLTSLQSYVDTYPSLSGSIRALSERVDNLESMSFSFVHPEEMTERFEHFDGRILDLEGWRDDHDKHHAAIDADTSSRGRIIKIDGGSFASLHSLDATDSKSSAAFLSASREEIRGIKERLGDLEAALPSLGSPWEIEVVLLPWGSDLKGIWFVAEESDSWKSSVQDTEEWTQARNLVSSSASALNSSFHSGWSNEEIAGWADHTTEWLSPKACGTKNLAYKRLQSRGFVRTVRLTGYNSGDIQAAIAQSFAHLQDHLSLSPDTHEDTDGETPEEKATNDMPGLRASFIPLRKVLRSSRLRFLSRSEMATSALWNAQFLTSGVMMRVSGGLKRLFVTTREAYIQQESIGSEAWTWQRLRELSRVKLDQEESRLQNDDEQSHVAEADAREACWAFCPGLDPPVSAATSFSSNHGDHDANNLAVVPFSSPEKQPPAQVARKTPQPADVSARLQGKQPISPLSEFPPSRRSQRRARTTSASAPDDETYSQRARRSFSGKRQLPSSVEAISNYGEMNTPVRRASKVAKRRRLTRSPIFESFSSTHESGPDPHPQRAHEESGVNHQDPDDNDDDDDEGPVSVTFTSHNAYNYTPRRSKEPPSPFFVEVGPATTAPPPSKPARASSGEIRKVSGGSTSAHGYHPTSISVQGGPSTKRATTPHAYATPHSGTGFGAMGAGDLDFDGDTEVDGSGSESGDEWGGLGGEDEDVEAGAAAGRSFRSDDEDGSGFGFEEEDDDDNNNNHGGECVEQLESQEMDLDNSDDGNSDFYSDYGFGEDAP